MRARTSVMWTPLMAVTVDVRVGSVNTCGLALHANVKLNGTVPRRTEFSYTSRFTVITAPHAPAAVNRNWRVADAPVASAPYDTEPFGTSTLLLATMMPPRFVAGAPLLVSCRLTLTRSPTSTTALAGT